MDKLTNYRKVIEKILTEYAAIPYHYGDLKAELIMALLDWMALKKWVEKIAKVW